MSRFTKKVIQIVCYTLVVILGTIAIFGQILKPVETENGVNANGFDAFRFFTNDGNIICILISAILLVTLILSFFLKKEIEKKWLYILSLVSVVSEMIILLVVLFLLIPSFGFSLLMGYSMFVLHALNPILILIAFLFQDKFEEKLSVIEKLSGSISVLLYGIVTLTLCISKVWEGKLIPYPFLDVYNNSVWLSIIYIFVILGGAMGLSYFFHFINQKNKKRV